MCSSNVINELLSSFFFCCYFHFLFSLSLSGQFTVVGLFWLIRGFSSRPAFTVLKIIAKIKNILQKFAQPQVLQFECWYTFCLFAEYIVSMHKNAIDLLSGLIVATVWRCWLGEKTRVVNSNVSKMNNEKLPNVYSILQNRLGANTNSSKRMLIPPFQ